MNPSANLKVCTPGRICLFGEHQDYLGLPVIAMAISLYACIEGRKRKDNQFIINKPDINESEIFFLNNLEYTKSRDYFKSGLKVCLNEGLVISSGLECTIKSTIPIQAGTSSSSAIMVSWIHLLIKVSDNQPDWNKKKIANLAYKAEVLEFSEPCGMMDQYSTSIGGIIKLDTSSNVLVTKLKKNLGTFVLGDSKETKDTIKILKKCKDSRISLLNKYKRFDSSFDLATSKLVDNQLSDLEKKILKGTIKNRDLLQEGFNLLNSSNFDKLKFGTLLNEQHKFLRDILKISTSKIEKLISVALKAGALGAKINGSGGGGCMFAYAPINPEKIVNAINLAGGKGYILNLSEGTSCLEN